MKRTAEEDLNQDLIPKNGSVVRQAGLDEVWTIESQHLSAGLLSVVRNGLRPPSRATTLDAGYCSLKLRGQLYKLVEAHNGAQHQTGNQ